MNKVVSIQVIKILIHIMTDVAAQMSKRSRQLHRDLIYCEYEMNNIPQDEHGQSMIHFAAVRSYSKDGLYHLLLETQVNVGFRDELYRTARDVAEQANIRENIEEIDRYVMYLAARGEKNKVHARKNRRRNQ